jgi:hypothetical protein
MDKAGPSPGMNVKAGALAGHTDVHAILQSRTKSIKAYSKGIGRGPTHRGTSSGILTHSPWYRDTLSPKPSRSDHAITDRIKSLPEGTLATAVG